MVFRKKINKVEIKKYDVPIMNILFRTAGGSVKNTELGTGHIFRTINLAKKFKNHKIFFAVEDYGGVKKILQGKCFEKIYFLNLNPTLEQDVENTLKIIKKNKIDCVIIDKIYTKKTYLKKLQKEIFTVYIADLKNYDYPADLVINGFIGFKNKITLNKYKKRCLVGPSFQILSSEYERKMKIKKDIDLLITFGGFDANNLVEKLCMVLPIWISKLKIKIILGPITKKPSCLSKIEETQKNLKVVKFTKNFRKEISRAKFGLCSGGLTTYEFALSKVPFGIITQYKHQEITAKQWDKYGYGEFLGENNNQIEEEISRYIQKITKTKVSFNPKNMLVDGYGAERVKDEILESVLKSKK